MSTSLFTQPIVGPSVMEEAQRQRAAAVVVARDVLGDRAYPDAMVQLAEYMLTGYGAYRLAVEGLRDLGPEEMRPLMPYAESDVVHIPHGLDIPTMNPDRIPMGGSISTSNGPH